MATKKADMTTEEVLDETVSEEKIGMTPEEIKEMIRKAKNEALAE